MKKSDINAEIQELFETWDHITLEKFLFLLFPLYEMYDISEDNDWIKNYVGEKHLSDVCKARTAYFLSKISDFFSGKFSMTKIRHGRLWEQMEKIQNEENAKNISPCPITPQEENKYD